MNIQKAEHTIYALRNGVVPNIDLKYLIVGRDNELNACKSAIKVCKDGSGVVKIIKGEYGSGKSFFLKKIKQDALNQNFVVAKVQIDRSFRFNKLEDFYYHIMHNLYKQTDINNKSSFDEIFNEWIISLRHSESSKEASSKVANVIKELNAFNASFSRAFLAYIRNKIKGKNELANAIISWLSGEKNIPFELKSQFEVVGNVDQTNALDFLNAFIKLLTLIGYSGLVIAVDELELIMNARSDIRKASYTNLRNIIDLGASGQISNAFFIFAATPELIDNEEKGLPSYEALYQRVKSNLSSSKNGIILSLNKPDFHHLSDLTQNVLEIYKTANPFDFDKSSETLRNWALFSKYQDNLDGNSINLREYLMTLIEILDLLKENPSHPIFKSELKIIADADELRFVNHF